MKNKKTSSKFLLLYSNKTVNDICFLREFEELASHNPNFKMVLFITRETYTSVAHEHKRIDKEALLKYAGKLEGKTFFVCGGNDFVKNMKDLLLSLNVPREKILSEDFGNV